MMSFRLQNYWVTRSVEQRADDTAYKRVYALYDAARRTGLMMEGVYALWLAASGVSQLSLLHFSSAGLTRVLTKLKANCHCSCEDVSVRLSCFLEIFLTAVPGTHTLGRLALGAAPISLPSRTINPFLKS